MVASEGKLVDISNSFLRVSVPCQYPIRLDV